MTRNRGSRRIFLMVITGLTMVALAHQFDILGRVSYAFEKGKLQAGLDHVRSIDIEQVASIDQMSHAFSLISDVVKPSVVYIVAVSENKAVNKQLEQIFGRNNFDPEPSTGTGSGVIIDEDGYIVTNNHVVADADTVRVTLADGRKYRAEVIGADPKTDVAVIKINAKRLHPATLGDSTALRVGHIVLAIGSPFRLGHSVSHGIVSALGRSNVAVDIDYQNWIQTDAPINPGNSGGPLINSRGEVIGINTAIATESGGNQGVGFAIPSNTVRMIAWKLKTGQRIVRGYLGISMKPVDQAVAGAYGLDDSGGVLVEQVGPDSPAAAGGLRPEDIILAIDGQRLASMEDLQQIIAATEPNRSVNMTIWRAGQNSTLAVRIGEQPEDFSTSGSLRDLMRVPGPKNESRNEPARDRGSDPVSTNEDDIKEPKAWFASLGFQAATVSPRLSSRFKLDKDIVNGAVITRVTSTGEAYAAGLRSGHIICKANSRRINNIRELEQVLTEEAIATGVRLVVRHRDMQFHVVLRVQ